MDVRSRLSMFGVGEIPAVSSNRLRTTRTMATTSSSGWPNNRFATARLQCGAVPTQDSISGRQQRNSRHIWQRSFPLQPLIRVSIILSTQNVGLTYDVQWYTLTSGHAAQNNLFADQKFWRTKFLDAYKKHIPFKSLDSFVGNPSLNFQRILKHPVVDAYYDGMGPTREQFQKITLPVLTITGQYDGDESGALSYYRDHLANASPEARAKHFLVIGPWDHAGTRTPTDEVAGIKFGPAAIVDLNDLHRKWYDWTMKDGPRPEFLKNKVAYYLLAPGNTGANGEWKYADNFETLVANPKIFHFDSKNSDANGVFRSGSLTEKRANEGSDTFTYDPLDTARGETVDGVDQNEKTAGIDQTYALSINKDGLVYHTEPLPSETPLIGCPAVTLWVSIDTPDVDFSASLYEIQPDGTSIELWSDTRRLRYRESLREAKLVKPGEIVRCDFNPGLFVARRLMKGSRLRLVVSSPNSTQLAKELLLGRSRCRRNGKRRAHLSCTGVS